MIEAYRLTKRYGDVVAAADVSFSVEPGLVVGILGPNGAGKTTILRMLAGILTPTEGHALIGGHDPTLAPLEAKSRIGFLSGDTKLYQRLTPREVLRHFGEINGLDRTTIAQRTEHLATQLQMTDFVDQRCGTLSSGQTQKANLARAFLHDPPALILDEPTTALDIVTGRFVLEAIDRARTGGKAVLFSTHTMTEAEFLCDRVILLHQGRVMDAGPIPDVCDRAGARSLADAFLKRVDVSDGAG